MGQIRKVHTNVRLNQQQLAQIDAIARREDAPRSYVVRRLIDKALAQEQAPDTVRADVL